MATSPGYDANKVERDFGSIVGTRAACPPAAPLAQPRDGRPLRAGLDVQARHGGGRARHRRSHAADGASTTAGYCTEYGKPVYNFADQSGPEQFGRVSFAAGAPALDQLRLLRRRQAARRAQDPRVRQALRHVRRSPASRRPARSSGRAVSTRRGRLFFPKHDYQVDPGRLAFGQERLGVTPLQMAMVASAIANGGVLMQPYLVEQILRPNGKVVCDARSRRRSGA